MRLPKAASPQPPPEDESSEWGGEVGEVEQSWGQGKWEIANPAKGNVLFFLANASGLQEIPRSQGDRAADAANMMQKDAVDLSPLSQAAIPAVKELIAEVVLEFYGDLEFLPKDRDGLLRYYERTGYLRDLDGHALIYGPGDGLFLVLSAGDTVAGCGGLRRLAGEDAELTRLWLKRAWRGKGLGLGIFRSLIGRAESLGYARVFLDTSRRCSDAVRLFRRNGFAECAPYKESAGDLFLCREFARPAEAPAASEEH